LKLMMDRLVCADGGNLDPTSTHGKDQAQAKALELDGWPYPNHFARRTYGVAVHAMWPASRAYGARCATGSTGWA
jgi:multimeric flavodoxin WrbA